MSKDKGEAAVRWEERHQQDKIKSHTHQVGHPRTGEQYHQRSSPTVVKVLSFTSGFPAWISGKGTGNLQGTCLWRRAGFDYRISTGLGEPETPFLEGTNKILCAPRSKGKEQWPHRGTEPDLLLLEGLLWRCGSALACREDGALERAVLEGAPWHKSPWRLPLTLPQSL